MTGAPKPSEDSDLDVPTADSGGVPWSGRQLTGAGFGGDMGEADVDLVAALDDPQDETALMHVVAKARLLIPIVAAPSEADDSGGPMVEKSTDMAAGTLISIGNPSLVFSKTFSLSGIAFGTIVAIAAYHMARALAPQHLKDSAGGAVIVVGKEGTQKEDDNLH